MLRPASASRSIPRVYHARLQVTGYVTRPGGGAQGLR